MRLKWVGNTARQMTPKQESPGWVGDRLFGVHLLILHFKFQHIPNPSNLQNIPFPKCPKCPKITQKISQNRKRLVNILSGGVWRCLKREQDIGRKAMHVKRHQTACTKTRNNETKPPKRNHRNKRNDRNERNSK